jgi:hypothetical protein
MFTAEAFAAERVEPQPGRLCATFASLLFNPLPSQVFGIGSSALMPSQQAAEQK